MHTKQHFRTNGKLLLTGEYCVLEGALALAIPLKYGQEMIVYEAAAPQQFEWRSYDEKGNCWFEAVFSYNSSLIQCSDEEVGKRLETLFVAIEQEHPGFWKNQCISKIETWLDFPLEWGLGTSSTLVAALAKWAKVDPFILLGNSFGGSGYDIACAMSDSPVLYQRRGKYSHWVEIPYYPPMSANMHFVYLGKKQNSREEIKRYRSLSKGANSQLKDVSMLSLQFVNSQSLKELTEVIEAHELVVSQLIQMTAVKEKLFADFSGSIKSLGAWGGDFVMVVSSLPSREVKEYFKGKGYPICFAWKELIL